MSAVLDDPDAYKKNPLFNQPEYGDFTAFYVTIAICTVIGFSLFILNIFFCWCSEHSEYWLDSNTGNRWIFSLWTKTPYKQPPLDLTELTVEGRPQAEYYDDHSNSSSSGPVGPKGDFELIEQHHQLKSKESDL